MGFIRFSRSRAHTGDDIYCATLSRIARWPGVALVNMFVAMKSNEAQKFSLLSASFAVPSHE
jgi:hypothetical protein